MKEFLVWLALCLVTAGATVAGIQALDQSLGLQQKVARLGK